MTQGLQKETADGAVRLNKYISDAGVCSRREADRLIETGKVEIDGMVATLGSRVCPGQRVKVDGRLISREEEMVLLAVNKPRGVVCTTDTRWGDQTIYELLNYPKRIFSIGRLDKDSEGLLLMTNNGDILNKIMRAGNYHEKEYVVTVDKEVTPEFLKKMSEGIYLEELDVKTRPCLAEKAGSNSFRISTDTGTEPADPPHVQSLSLSGDEASACSDHEHRAWGFASGRISQCEPQGICGAQRGAEAFPRLSYGETRIGIMEKQIERMRKLSAMLQAASKAYYQEDKEIMSNLEYDRLYDELAALEKETGIVLSGSPTVTVGYESAGTAPEGAT